MQPQNKAFSKYTPSLFILDTPFQLLCAIEAINEFEMTNYLIIASFAEEEKRSGQVVQMLEELDLNYKIESMYDYWSMVDSYVNDDRDSSIGLVNDDDKWDRIFIGNYNSLDQWVWASKYASPYATIVFLDDGNTTIELLRKGHGINKDYESQFIRIWNNNYFDFGPYFFTVFFDVVTKRNNVYPNTLSHFVSMQFKNETNNTIYVIGTNSEAYCSAVGLDISEYEEVLWEKLSELRSEFPNNDIVYIPHGRDTCVVIQKYCDLLGVSFLTINYAVEWFFIKNMCKPMSIYGFGSTALFTLKMLMPTTTVVNWFVDNPYGISYLEYYMIAKYYREHNVLLDKIPYIYNCKNRKRYFLVRITNFFLKCFY